MTVPPLSRELVQCLYHQAKAEHVPPEPIDGVGVANSSRVTIKRAADSVLKKNRELTGFADVREVKKVVMPVLAKHMARIIIIARKLPNSPKPPKLEMA